MQHKLYLDIETFSEVSLPDCGKDKYAEGSEFTILLFGYAIDDEPVTVVDLAFGETLSYELVSMLYDPQYTKIAHNAAFEMVCISRYLNRPVDANQWEDTMVLSASCGLPLSLDAVGSALGLSEEEAKMKEGKLLVREFCLPRKPTKANPHTRMYPEDDFDNWLTFIEYNRRDVETERVIYHRLEKWKPSFSEHKLWVLDQQINNRGIKIDTALAKNAIAIGDEFREKLLDKAKDISGLDNPNSNDQVKKWLSEQEGIEVVSLNKKEIAKVVAGLSADASKEFMELRKEFSKSSIKKYEAMLRCTCADDHARGCFQFYGASTGRWCLTGDHEVLTTDGWCRLDEWTGGSIACWTPTMELISFQKAKALEFDYSGPMYDYEDSRISQVSTPDHKMYFKRRYDSPWETGTVESMSRSRPSIPFTGYRLVRPGMEAEKLRVLVMVQADGCFSPEQGLKLGFTKLRKVERCKKLLRAAGIPFTYTVYESESKPRHQFTVATRNIPLWLRQFQNKTFGTWLFNESADAFFDELQYWDGCKSAKNSIQYSTCNKTNADIVQAFAHLSGRAAHIRVKHRGDEHPGWSDAYVVDIWLTPKNCHNIRVKPVLRDFSGKVYCAETKTGFFLVRRNGKVWVTGNSGRLIQFQNLPHDTLPDLDNARAIVRAGDAELFEFLYPETQSALSALLRTALIPEDGHRFIVADFSAIEARVIAWIADEKWRLKTFEEGGDIYCASASQAFHVPVVKHGVNGELRQVGKVMELACIAEGQLVLTDRGFVPIEQVTTDMRVWDGREWVPHEGVVYKGLRSTIYADGIELTPDHRVLTTDGMTESGKTGGLKWDYVWGPGALVGRGSSSIIRIRAGRDNVSVYDIINAGPRHRFCVFDKETDSIRCVSNCGYGGGVGAMKAFGADRMGMSEEEMAQNVQKWRESSPHIVALWKALEDAAVKSIRHKSTEVSRIGGIGFTMEDGVLWMTLPSGRRIAYWGAEMGQDKWGRPSMTYMTQNQTTKKWTRTETFGGKLAENCLAGNTVVVTDSGPKRLHKVAATDLVWDGANFVKHSGLVYKGLQACILVDGVWLTPDHKIFTKGGWKNAASTNGLDRAYVRLPHGDGAELKQKQPRKLSVAGPRRSGKYAVDYTEINQPVYDLLNCGPNHRFVVYSDVGPMLVHNCVQATARDCLKEALFALDAGGYDVRGTVHDEVIITKRIGEGSVAEAVELMCKGAPWMDGLPLNADGYECTSYRKD